MNILKTYSRTPPHRSLPPWSAYRSLKTSAYTNQILFVTNWIVWQIFILNSRQDSLSYLKIAYIIIADLLVGLLSMEKSLLSHRAAEMYVCVYLRLMKSW